MDTAKDTRVQQVNRKSSDELLRKFAEVSGDSEGRRILRLPKRRKTVRDRKVSNCERSTGSSTRSGLLERKRLLPLTVTRRDAMLRRLGVGKSQFWACDVIRHKSLVGTIGKTWHCTVKHASRMFIEKQYKHKRLINDFV